MESRVPLSAATVFPSVVTRIIPFVEIGPFSANVAGIVCGDSSKRTPAAAANQGNGINLLCLAGDLSIGQILTRQPKTKRRTPSVQSVTTFLRRLDVNAGIHGSGRVLAHARADHSARYMALSCLPIRLGDPSSAPSPHGSLDDLLAASVAPGFLDKSEFFIGRYCTYDQLEQFFKATSTKI